MKALLLPTGYRKPEVVEHDGGIQDLQGLVGGYLEQLPFPGALDVVAFANEESKIEGLEPNLTATFIFRQVVDPRDWIAGPMLVCGVTGPEVVAVPDRVIDFFTREWPDE